MITTTDEIGCEITLDGCDADASMWAVPARFDSAAAGA
jgi:hypothetical protein